MTSCRTLLVAATLVAAGGSASAADPFRFKDGDRVVLLGSTLIEREQKSGYWEYALTLRNLDVNVTFRNLGWSGDTVWGESRNGFDESPKGFERLVTLTKELKPTVIVVCYGQVESFAGPAGVAKFADGLKKLLDALAPTKARIVLMTPTPFEDTPPMTAAAEANSRLLQYSVAIRRAASERKLEYVDLMGTHTQAVREIVREYQKRLPLAEPGMPAPKSVERALTDNGMHLTPAGYRATAGLLFGNTQKVLLQTTSWTDPTPEGKHLLAAIVRKNELFFHRWRPQNETYLFGFRKHEQGKNAAEVAAFDPLVADAEKKIAELKKTITVFPAK